MCVARVLVCGVWWWWWWWKRGLLTWIRFLSFAGFDTKIVGLDGWWTEEKEEGWESWFSSPFMIYQLSYSLRDPPAAVVRFPRCSYSRRKPLQGLATIFSLFFFSWLFMLSLLTTTIITTYLLCRTIAFTGSTIASPPSKRATGTT